MLFINVNPRPKQKAEASARAFLRDLELMNLLENEDSQQKSGRGRKRVALCPGARLINGKDGLTPEVNSVPGALCT